MARDYSTQKQEANTVKLIVKTYLRVTTRKGTTAGKIVNFLRQKFGDVLNVTALKQTTENILKQSEELGFVHRNGHRYLATIVREQKSYERLVSCSKRRRCVLCKRLRRRPCRCCC